MVGAAETVAAITEWAMNYLILNPGVQRKAQAQIDETVGRSTAISSKDAFQLPYVEAVFLEVLRISNMVPFFAHSATEEVHFEGFVIPKGHC